MHLNNSRSYCGKTAHPCTDGCQGPRFSSCVNLGKLCATQVGGFATKNEFSALNSSRPQSNLGVSSHQRKNATRQKQNSPYARSSPRRAKRRDSDWRSGRRAERVQGADSNQTLCRPLGRRTSPRPPRWRSACRRLRACHKCVTANIGYGTFVWVMSYGSTCSHAATAVLAPNVRKCRGACCRTLLLLRQGRFYSTLARVL